MSPANWLVAHLVSVALLAGVGWVVQIVVYPGFERVGRAEWAAYHAGHTRGIARVVAVPWILQAVSTVALLVAPPSGQRLATLVLAALALAGVAATVLVAVPAHRRLDGPERERRTELAVLLRANLVRTWAWTLSTALAAALQT
jgi:hypothetical protein